MPSIYDDAKDIVPFITVGMIHGSQIVTIVRYGTVKIEVMGKDDKQAPALWFKEFDRPLALKNSSLVESLVEILGDNTDNYKGKKITIALFNRYLFHKKAYGNTLTIKPAPQPRTTQRSTSTKRAPRKTTPLSPEDNGIPFTT